MIAKKNFLQLTILFSFSIGLPSTNMADDAAILAPTKDFSKAEKYEALPAGSLTHHKILNQHTFSHASANMSFERELDFKLGNAIFKRIWITAPASTQSSDGLGPLFNSRSCQSCHIKDGRGHPPQNAQDNRVSMLIRLAIPPQNDQQKRLLAAGKMNSIGDPTYGSQLQDHSITGLHAEGKFNIHYTESLVTLSDGETVRLRKPKYTIKPLFNGPLHPQIMISPRIAPQMIGLGLLEAISADDIERQADPDDQNQDGISGKAQKVWSIESQTLMLGRFGHKAGMPNLNQQNQGAFNNDIGLSVPLFPSATGDCTSKQAECLQQTNGNSAQFDHLEVSRQMTDLVLHYTRNLAVPARREVNHPDVLAGKALFYHSGCIDCHTPKYITPRDTAHVEQSRQLIWPYTDLLLHDMGEGLADNLTEAQANGREWKTPPLWGIGLTPRVNGHSFYLHDGRARNLLEAILWHSGEAEPAKQHVISMSKKERQQLIRFVKSL
ncbi:thiol oxidoreductase [Candidatus Endobugula sertula]|uniref:Thiol oxidoreductase n=1 Tax=Candidatus Endobugula sertula TaxID=62101 RepID=A0A1D2QTC4_9GAMM|nr:thiol oxidoreductase [Candidatus Endobugula sertula]